MKTKIKLTFVVEHDGTHVFSPNIVDFIEGGCIAVNGKPGSHGGRSTATQIMPGSRIDCAIVVNRPAKTKPAPAKSAKVKQAKR